MHNSFVTGKDIPKDRVTKIVADFAAFPYGTIAFASISPTNRFI